MRLGIAVGTGIRAGTDVGTGLAGAARAIDQDRYLFWASAARVPSGALVTAATGTNYVMTRKRFGSPQYAIDHLRLHFSGFACTEGNAPQETQLPGNDVNIDGVWIAVEGGTATACAFDGDAGTSFVSGSLGAWTDDLQLPAPIAAESMVDVYTLYHSAIGENQVPVHLIGINDRVWGAADAASLLPLIGTDTPSTAALATYPSVPPMYYGPDMMVAKGWDGRPVALVMADSIGERQNDHILAADARGNMGWLRRWLDTADPTHGRTPHFIMGVPGASSDRELIVGSSDKRWQVLDQIIAFNGGKRPFTCVLDQLGQNNLGSDIQTRTQTSIDLIDRITARYPGAQTIGIGQLIHPASSDGFRTLANQTYQTYGEWPGGLRYQVEANRAALLSGRYIGYVEVVSACGLDVLLGRWPEPYFITHLAADAVMGTLKVTLVDKPMLGDFLHFDTQASPALANVIAIAGTDGAWQCTLDRGLARSYSAGQEVYAPNSNDGSGTPRNGTHPRARMIRFIAETLPQAGKGALL